MVRIKAGKYLKSEMILKKQKFNIKRGYNSG